jgi:DUF971 family protein
MLEPLQIIEESDSSVTIEWSDGKSFLYNASQLRKVCPCAGCVDEWTGKRTLNEKNVANDLTFKRIGIVGRYALNFVFSDEHDSGIFSFNYLRGVSENNI